MQTLTRWVLGHRRLVLVGWLLVTLAAFALLPRATGALSLGFDVPNREGFDVNRAIEATYGNAGVNSPSPLVPVVSLPEGTTVTSPGVRRELASAFAAVEEAVPDSRVASFASTGDPAFVSEDGRTTFGIVYFRPDESFDTAGPALEQTRSALADLSVAGAPFEVTGLEVLRAGEGGGEGPSVLIEALLGGVGALVVLVLVFGSVLALVPLVMAAVTIPVAFLLVWALTTVTEVSVIVQFLIALIGLGVAIDYALLIVMRWREERQGGLENVAAVERAMATAGKAVVFSGVAVAIGLLALIALPVPFLRSVGYGGMLIPLVSVAVATSLLPVVLASAGPRLDRRAMRRSERTGGVWNRWSRLVVRRRWVAGAVGLAVMAALFVPAFSLAPGDPRADALASGGEAGEGLAALERSGLGAGVLTPFAILLEGGDPELTAVALDEVEGVQGVVAPIGEDWRRDGTAIVEAFPSDDGSSDEAADTLDRVREEAATLPGRARVGGQAALDADFVSAVYGSFPLMAALILIITFVLLARSFRSLLLPLKAVVFNVLSIGAVWGFLVLVWQRGYGSDEVFGIAATGAITSWVPLMVFAFLYGLSMDYEVFILSRMREEYDRTGSTDGSVVTGIARTGRLVTSASLILFLAFVALASGPGTEVKILATGLAVGIVLDATILRAILLPALVSLFGRWNWWLPPWPARLLRVEPSIPAREEAP